MSNQVPKDSFDKIWLHSMHKSSEIACLKAKLEDLKLTLRPAIEAARDRKSNSFQLKDDEALLEAGCILGVE